MTISIKHLIYIVPVLTILAGCEQRKTAFDSEKWKRMGLDWQITDVRENMIDDLINSETLIGLQKQGIIELLGEPGVNNSIELRYLVREKIYF